MSEENHVSDDFNPKRVRSPLRDDEDLSVRVNQVKRVKYAEGLDIEAGDDSEDDDNEDDESGSDDENYVADDFLVLEEEEPEEEDEKEDTKNKKVLQKLKKRKNQLKLDEEDELLIHDHMIDKEENYGETIPIQNGNKMNDLNDDEELLDVNKNNARIIGYSEEDDDDLDDFIAREDDDDDDDDDNEYHKERRAPLKANYKRDKEGPTYDQVQEAIDIFGHGYDQFSDEENEDKEDFVNDDGNNQELLSAVKDKKMIQRLRSKYDRNQLVMGFCTDADESIRQTDRPERFLTSSVANITPTTEQEKDDEPLRDRQVKWMATKLSDKMSAEFVLEDLLLVDEERRLSLMPSSSSSSSELRNIQRKRSLVPRVHSDNNNNNTILQRELIPVVRSVLDFLEKDNLDIPFIWTYRRDYLHKHMESKHVWDIFEMRSQWDSLELRKERITKQFKRLREATEDEETLRNRFESSKAKCDELVDLCDEYSNALKFADECLENIINNNNNDQEDRVREAKEEVMRKTDQLKVVELKLYEAESDLKVCESVYLSKRLMDRDTALGLLTLFPLDRYEPMLLSGDEQVVKDVSLFFHTICKDGSGKGKEKRSNNDNNNHDNEESDPKLLSKRKDDYTKFKSIQTLRDFIDMFCVSACDFGDSLRHGFKREPPNPTNNNNDKDMTMTCEQAAEVLVDSKVFRSTSEVIRAAKIVISTELGTEPTVRRAAREVFRASGSVSTVPTAKGLTAISPFSELFGIHYLDRKPIAEFFQGQDRTLFLKLTEARDMGLIDIVINAAGNRDDDVSPYLTSMRLVDKFLPSPDICLDPSMESRQSWDRMRLEILSDCLEKIVIPSLKAELVREMVKIGREVVVVEAANRFESLLRVGPFRPAHNDSRDETKELLLSCPHRPFNGSVVSIYQSQGREPMCLAFVNRDGVLRAHDMLPENMSSQRNAKIREFLLANKPDLVVMNSSGGHSSRSTFYEIEKRILPEVCEAVNKLKKRRTQKGNSNGYDNNDSDNEDNEDNQPYKSNVILINDDVAKIFKSSPRAKNMFPDLHQGCAAAVCLARFSQEPLAEYCNMWTLADANELFGFEAFFLNLHPLKSVLERTKRTLLKSLEYKLVDAVCSVGVDINKVVSNEHLSSLLIFVGGLGLRKADALKQNIRNNIGVVDSRNLLVEKKLLGSNVWLNAIGFLRIHNLGVDRDVDPLDNTRIHPECYRRHNFAPKICSDVLEMPIENNDHKEVVELLMKDVRKEWEKRIKKYPKWLDLWEHGRPTSKTSEYSESEFRVVDADGQEHVMGFELNDCLSLLQLDDYAKDLEMQDLGKRRLQLEQIKDELRFPWLDIRERLKSIDPIDMFHVLTNESDYSLYVGLKVSCEVKQIVDSSAQNVRTEAMVRTQYAKVETEIGLKGIISINEVFDDKVMDISSYNLSELLPVGKPIMAVVININKERLHLDLSIKPSYLNNDEAWWMEKRNKNKLAKDWWLNIKKKDPQNIFDEHFNEQQALKSFSEAERQQRKTSEMVSIQMNNNNTVSLYSSNHTSQVSSNKNNRNTQKVRIINHTLFANLDYKAAEEKLRSQSKGPGEVVIRPSSKGPDFLTITWAYRDNYFKHIIVQEKGKRVGDLGLGSDLVIVEEDMASETFSDLDEIFSRYITPMNDYISTMTQHRTFHPGTPEEVEIAMQTQLSQTPNRIPYFIRFEPKLPGQFVLTWLSLNANSIAPVKTDLIAVRPYGYRIRNETFARPSEIIVWFKTSMETKMANEAAAAQAKLTAARKTRFTQDRASKYVIAPINQSNNMNSMNNGITTNNIPNVNPVFAYSHNSGY